MVEKLTVAPPVTFTIWYGWFSVTLLIGMTCSVAPPTLKTFPEPLTTTWS